MKITIRVSWAFAAIWIHQATSINTVLLADFINMEVFMVMWITTSFASLKGKMELINLAREIVIVLLNAAETHLNINRRYVLRLKIWTNVCWKCKVLLAG